MITYPQIDPVFFTLGPLQLRWYGLMYVLGFAATALLVMYQSKQFGYKKLSTHMESLNMFLIIGVVLGGRLGYVLLYNLDHYLHAPLDIFTVWKGGMAFHGGALGCLLAGAIYCFLNRINFWKAADIYIVTVPIGLFFGRIGNFINGELYGRTTELPWGMVFPGAGSLPRHPSQLYEALLEGLVLFLLLWTLRKKPWQQQEKQKNQASKTGKCWPHGSLLALFLMGYGVMRSLVECVREPDPQLGFQAWQLTRGQELSFIMIIAGLGLWLGLTLAAKKRGEVKSADSP